MVYFVMVFVPRLWDKKRTLFDEFSWCAGIAKHLCSFVSTGGTTVHWHSEKASIQSLFLPHTAEWETSDLSLLYYPDAPAPLGNEIPYYVYHAKPSSGGLKTNGEAAIAPVAVTKQGSSGWEVRSRMQRVLGDLASAAAGLLIGLWLTA